MASLNRKPSNAGENVNRTSDPDERRAERRIDVNEPASFQMLSPLQAERFDAHVLDLSRHGVKIRTQILLERGVILQVRLREMLIMGEVRHCARAADGFHVGLYIQDCVERRTSERLQADMSARICKLANAVEPQEEYPGTILNQSDQGLLVFVKQRIRPGSRVHVIAGESLFVATVAYCYPEGDGFKIGLEVHHMRLF